MNQHGSRVQGAANFTYYDRREPENDTGANSDHRGERGIDQADCPDKEQVGHD